MAEIIHIESKRPFDINEEPCANCPKQKECNTTCLKAQRWFNQLAQRLKGEKETKHFK